MRNSFKENIQNIKGTRRAISLIDKGPQFHSPTKPKLHTYSNSHKESNTKMKNRGRQEKLESEICETKNESRIVEDIGEIKKDIKMIKSYLFGSSFKSRMNKIDQQKEEYDDMDQQETVYPMGRQARMKSHGSEIDEFFNNSQNQNLKNSSVSSSPQKKIYKIEDILKQKMKKTNSNSGKSTIHLKILLASIKEYKLEGDEIGTIFYGYAKRNSQPVAVKYFEERIDHIIEVYDRLWKNIAKAEWPCINRIFDYKADELNVLIMEKNKNNIVGLPYKNILMDLIKIMEFIHDCGYLYRNIEPEHFMLNQEGQLVVIDFKRARRFIDFKGRPVGINDIIYTGSPFASNNQVRCLPECRKDDLESIGYLALLLNEMEIPWGGMGKEQVIRVRSGLKLQELFGERPELLEYMIYVTKLGKNERPDYQYLSQVIGC